MSYGLQIKNNNNEFLISSDMRNLHHYATYTNPSISVPFTNYGGLTRFTYTFTLNSAYIPVPFFTTPFVDRYYAIEKVSQSGNTWTVQLISSSGFPTTTDNGDNPSGGQLTETITGPVYSRAASISASADYIDYSWSFMSDLATLYGSGTVGSLANTSFTLGPKVDDFSNVLSVTIPSNASNVTYTNGEEQMDIYIAKYNAESISNRIGTLSKVSSNKMRLTIKAGYSGTIISGSNIFFFGTSGVINYPAIRGSMTVTSSFFSDTFVVNRSTSNSGNWFWGVYDKTLTNGNAFFSGGGLSQASSDRYSVIHTPSSTSSTFTGTAYHTIVWNGVRIVDNVAISVSNGVPNTSYSGGVTDSSDDNLYEIRITSADTEPTSISDGTSSTEVVGSDKYYYHRIKQTSYVSTSGSSGNLATGSYGSVQIPKLIVFADARAVISSDTYGLQVLKDDGSAAFDNRKKPLVIKEVTAVSHQSTATNNFSGSGLSARNASGPTSTWSTQATPNRFVGAQVNTMPTNAMYSFASVTQVHQQVSRTELEEECDGVEVKGNCLGSRRTYTWRSTYWNFYRGGIQRFSDTVIYGGYMCAEFGSYHSRTTSGGFFGFSTGNSSGSTVGKWPWDSAQINNAGTGVNTLLIADATNYI